jgi:G3E family GTPase
MKDMITKKTEIPVLLLTGYLGSGKTTLLNRILTNRRGIKFAVIVNDIGEVNIDADLIEKGGIVNEQDDSLVALQNGCICCTLKMDLVKQLEDIIQMNRFDYIVIEASGICEPGPIAQTICSIPSMVPDMEVQPRLDCIVTVVDALRMRDEFGSGLNLTRPNIDEEDIENLVIQQIEFCNIVLLNKAAEVSTEELSHIREVIRALQSKAEILECNYGDVELDKIVNTQMFDFDDVATSARWIQAVEAPLSSPEGDTSDHHHDDDDDDDEHEHHHEHDDDDEHHHDDDDDDEHEHHYHEHHHHHHHHHDEGEAEEYGIGTYVYYARRPFSLSLFDEFVARKWPKGIIRAKGICWFKDEPDVCYLFEQAGRQVGLRNAGQWYATMPKDELEELMARNPGLRQDWDDEYGDRMQKLAFIGQHLDKQLIADALDFCLI